MQKTIKSIGGDSRVWLALMRRRAVVGIIGGQILLACTHADKADFVSISADIPPMGELPEPPPEADQRLESLEAIVGKGSQLAANIEDLRQIIMAERSEKAGDHAQALQHWKQALTLARGSFGKMAFEGWIRSYARTIERPMPPNDLAKLLLAETSSGRISPYMIESRITDPVPLIRRLPSLIPEKIAPESSSDPSTTKDGLAPPASQGPPADDPLLIATAETRCRAGADVQDKWQKWTKSLSRQDLVTFDALVAICESKLPAKELGDTVEKALGKLEATNSASHFRLLLAEKVASLRRASGDRALTAAAFLKLIRTWDIVDASAGRLFGDSDSEFLLRRVNSQLWAARYLAIVGDYETAKASAKNAISLLDRGSFAALRRSQTFEDRLNEYKAEAYHILAFRIAAEARDWDKAIAFSTIAISDLKLSPDWRDRLRWYLGLYRYMAGQYDEARKVWEKLIEDTEAEKYRPQAYYWLSRAFDQLNKPDERDFFLTRLFEEYPLSYYAVVAPTLASSPTVKPWRTIFGDPEVLKQILSEKQSYDLAIWREDQTVSQLLERSEILVAAGLDEWARIATRELETYTKGKYALAKNVERFLYISRLLYMSGDYFRSIWLTTELSEAREGFWREYPEQILVYFPLPYRDTLVNVASQQGQELALYLSIGRQESSFRPNVVSGAGAIGIMQLLPQTAARYDENSNDHRVIAERLMLPNYNIEVGGRYLATLIKRYRGYSPAIFGAYNAGEYMVDTWLERRYFPDPLIWNEMIPFGETNSYIKMVWRNLFVYRYLATDAPVGIRLTRLSMLADGRP